MKPSARNLATSLLSTLLFLVLAKFAEAQNAVYIKPVNDAEGRCLHRAPGGFDLAPCDIFATTKAVFQPTGGTIAYGKDCVAAPAEPGALQGIPCPATPDRRTDWELAGGFLRARQQPDKCIGIVPGGATGTRAVLQDCTELGTRWESAPTAPVPASFLLGEPWDGINGWSVTGEPTFMPRSQLLLRRTPAINSVFRQDVAVPARYKLTVVAKIDAFTQGAENLGFKVHDGARRLMFQRRSDGFYAITSTSGGAWVKVHTTSQFTGWGEYQITVRDGAVSLRTRPFPNGTLDGPFTWTLPANAAADRLEVWVKGTAADAHMDTLILERVDSPASM